MPFVSEAYLRYLEQQFQVASNETSAQEDDSLPPAANMGDPFASNLPPSAGGRGSYPSGFNPQATGLEFPNSSELPQLPLQPSGLTPGYPNDEVPLPVGGEPPPGGVGPDDLATPPPAIGPGTPPPPGSGPQQAPPATIPPPMPTGRGVGYNPQGVNLTPRDRFNMGQDVDPRDNTGTPGGFNPPGPMGGPGTAGIVSPNSPAGGGSFFGGRLLNLTSAGGTTVPALGGGGGILPPGMANLYLHSVLMQDWAKSHGYKNIGDFMNQTGFSLAGGWPQQGGDRQGSGSGLTGGGRPMSSGV